MKAAVCRQFGAPLSIEDVTLARLPTRRSKSLLVPQRFATVTSPTKMAAGAATCPFCSAMKRQGQSLKQVRQWKALSLGDRVVITSDAFLRVLPVMRA